MQQLATATPTPPKPKHLLVVECTAHFNWYKIFEGATLSDGSPIVVEQAEWDDLIVTSYDDGSVNVRLRASSRPHAGTPNSTDRTFVAHFIFLRSVTHGIAGQDSRSKLLGLMHGNLPSVNSLQSAYTCLERPIVYGALRGIQKKLGRDAFPLIPQTLYTTHRDMLITPSFPLVAKVGHAHAGYGKMKFTNGDDFADFRGLVALHNDYVSAEPFIEWDWDGRIQKIGSHYRAFKRVSSNWKGNVGNRSIVTDLEMNDRYKQWVDECAKLFGGLDILGLDFVHAKDGGREVILELNDTAIGLVHKYEEEDMQFMRDLVVARMNQHFCAAKPAATGAPAVEESVESLRSQIAQLQAQLQRERVEAQKRIDAAEASATKKEKGIFGLF